MNTFQILPVPILHPFVDRLWGWENTNGDIVQLPTLLPGTGAELYFHYREPFRYAINPNRQEDCDFGHLFCIRHRPIQLSPSPNIGFIAVRFKVGMIHRFTKIPGKELLDRTLSVSEIWGASGTALLRHLSYSSTQGEKLSLIQSFLTEHLMRESLDSVTEKAMSRLYRQCSWVYVQHLAEDLNIGRRQLERRFKAFSGLSPIEIKGLSRFQHTARKLMLDASASANDIALANGYYDQSHFIHDFQRRINTTPQQYIEDARTKTHFYNTSRRLAGILRTPDASL